MPRLIVVGCRVGGILYGTGTGQRVRMNDVGGCRGRAVVYTHVYIPCRTKRSETRVEEMKKGGGG